MVDRVTVTAEATSVIEQLRHSHGEIIFHQSGGCCDGTAPSCLPADDFMINEADVLLGEIANCKFYMSRVQFEYMKYSQITLDVMKGIGSAFSLEIPLGYRFITKSKIVQETDQLVSPIQVAKISGKIPEL